MVDHDLLLLGASGSAARAARAALVAVHVPRSAATEIVDLCDPDALAKHNIRPDEMAARDTTVSQAAARKIHKAGLVGFRWWSSFFGEWHTVVLFLDRIEISQLRFGEPEQLTLQHPSVRTVAEALDMNVA